MSTNRGKSARHLPRAKKACQNCHARRVRCNVMETRPCHNCRIVGVTCELSKSKREANRERKMALLAQDLSTDHNNANTQEKQWTDWAYEDRQLASSLQQIEPSTTASNPSCDPFQPLDLQDAALDDHTTIVPSAKSSPRHPPASPINDETVYIGESNLLTLVASSDGHTAPPTNEANLESTNLAYNLPNSDDTLTGPNRSSQCTNGALDYLNHEGAFVFPDEEVIKTILQAYFMWFHPCFPILDISKVSQEYKSNKLSPMLLHAMLFIGTSYLADDFFPSAGFASRQDARFHFYHRAKILYDADWEVNKTAIVQTLFLISFWRSNASNDKDTRHWLGSAISFAQTRGYHRSFRRHRSAATQNSNMLSLRKRIWWSLYIRDRQCAASLGLPSRIRDEDCDVEKLRPEDFATNGDVEAPEIFGTSSPDHVQYCIKMAELAVLLGKIVLKKFAPQDDTLSSYKSSTLKSQLSVWEEGLPETMQARNGFGSIWSNMLHLQYNHLLILLYGSVNMGTEDSCQNTDHSLGLEAAYRNTRIIEDMLAKDSVQFGQIHLITCIFSTLCVHVLQMRHSARATARQLAEYRARICLVGLKELRFSWDSNNWILQLFYQFLDDETAKILNITEVKAGGRPSGSEIAIANRSSPARNISQQIDDAMCSTTSITGDPLDTTDRSSISMPPPQAPEDPANPNNEMGVDFMSQLLNLRDADDAFFDGTMDSDFTNAEMNLDGIFDHASPFGVNFFRP